MKLKNIFLRLLTSELFIVILIGFICLREAFAALKMDVGGSFGYDDYFLLMFPFDPVEGGGIYLSWLKLLGILFGVINALPINQALILLLAPMSLYVVLRLRGQSVFVTTTLVFLLLSGEMVRASSSTPLVSAFAIVVGLLWLTMVAKIASSYYTYAFFMMGSLVLMYIRPEYVLSFVIFLLITLFNVVKIIINALFTRNKITCFQSLFITGSLLITISVALWIGIPGKGGRLYDAFKQHFAINAITFTRYDPRSTDPWFEWHILNQPTFGSASTFREAIAANPHAIAAHIGMNVFRIPTELAYILGGPRHPSSLWFSLGIAGIAVIMTAGTWLARTLLRKRLFDTRSLLQRDIDWRWLTALLIWALPPLVSLFIIYPRHHYLALVVVWIIVGVFGAVRYHGEDLMPSPKSPILRYGLVPYLVLALAMYPDPFVRYPYPQVSQQIVARIEQFNISPNRVGTTHIYLSVLMGYQRIGTSDLAMRAQDLWVILVYKDEVDEAIKYISSSNLSFNVLNTGNPIYQLLINLEYCSVDSMLFVHCRS